MHSTILKGVRIGNNVIIGANSLVNKDIPDNCVAAGNPCKVITSLDDYYLKRKEAQVKEAAELVKLYREKYNEDPDESALHEFFWLFSNDPDNICDKWKEMNKLVGNEDYTKKVMRSHMKEYKNMSSFLDSVK